MWLIVGLGNPGKRYECTRHNAGFMFIDRLADRAGVAINHRECQALVATAILEGQDVKLVKPQTFMNLSGWAVSSLMSQYGLAGQDVLVVVDDFALPLGKVRIRRRGSDGGHNGLKSIIEELGTIEFPRIRLGIAPADGPIDDPVSFVLSDFGPVDAEAVSEMMARAVAAVSVILNEGIERAMTKFN